MSYVPDVTGYRALGLRLSKSCPLVSYVYLKQHVSKDTGDAVPGTLFVAGLPLGLDEDSIAAVFGCFGSVAQVVLHGTKKSGVVVFADDSVLASCLEHAGSGEIVEYEPSPPAGPIGLKAWVVAHKAERPGNDVLQKQLDEWMAAWEAAEEEKQQQQQAAMAEEGWTVVTRGKGRKRAKEGGAVVSGGVAAAAAVAASAKPAKKYEDFYRFQQRDRRRNELVDVQRKFEEDRKRISELRAARRFKPY